MKMRMRVFCAIIVWFLVFGCIQVFAMISKLKNKKQYSYFDSWFDCWQSTVRDLKTSGIFCFMNKIIRRNSKSVSNVENRKHMIIYQQSCPRRNTGR